jgi:predicted  nucleic acid-binding Zn-ribbon protein
MSQLDILKDQMQAMGNKLGQSKRDMEQLESIVNQLKQNKAEIEAQLFNAESQYEKLSENYKYLSEVQRETKMNYNQIENAATTLLDIIKSKCDSIS